MFSGGGELQLFAGGIEVDQERVADAYLKQENNSGIWFTRGGNNPAVIVSMHNSRASPKVLVSEAGSSHQEDKLGTKEFALFLPSVRWVSFCHNDWVARAHSEGPLIIPYKITPHL